MRNAFTCLGAVVFAGLMACEEPCDTKTEPRLQFSSPFEKKDSTAWVRTYDRVRLPNALTPNQTLDLNQARLDGVLPVSLVADSTVYVFEGRRRVDTVTVHYRRNVRFQRADCGYVITLDSFRVRSRVPFVRAEVSVLARRAGGFLVQPATTTYSLSLSF